MGSLLRMSSHILQGVEIRDLVPGERGGYLSFDLIDILRLIGPRVLDAHWRCRFVWCIGETSGQLHEISDRGVSVSGEELMRIVSGINQTIDGDFEARDGEAENAWLVIKAIDSSLFEVWSDDLELLRRVRETFQQVSDLPRDAA